MNKLANNYKKRMTIPGYIKATGVPSKGLTLEQWAMHVQVKREFGNK